MPHYYMFHKPFGCVTARRDDRYPTVMDYFEELQNDRLSPVGRLDRETTGAEKLCQELALKQIQQLRMKEKLKKRQ